MIYHVNERTKKRTSPESLFCPPHSSSLVFLLRLGYCRAHPTQQIWTNFLRLSLEIFVLFKYLMMCVASSMSTWLRIWPPWKESKNPRKQPNCKSLINKKQKLLHYNKKLLLHIPTYLSYIQKMNKNTNSSVSSPRGKKIPKPSFAGLPTIKLKQSYYHVYVDL